ncbi:MAG: hypothetical protein H6625_00110 [Bdellovibrionaceae bacterium]|nr:hypothetical protein [Pseudobdellovibrionaceae bacterium]
MKGLSKSIKWSFLLNGTLALIGVIRSKYLAVTFGTYAVGLLSQVLQLQLVSITIGSLGLLNGIINGLSKSGDNEQEKQQFLSAAFILQITVSTLLSIVVIIFAKQFSVFTFGSANYVHIVVLTMIGVPFLVLANNQLQAIFFSNSGFEYLNKTAIVINLLNLALFFVLVKFWGLDGAVATATTLAIIQFLLYLFSAQLYLSAKKIFKWAWNLDKAKFLVTFAATSLSTYVMIYGGNFIVRREVIHNLGLEANGILQVPISLSMYYVPMISWVLWGKVYPILVREKLAAAQNFKRVLLRSQLGFLVLASFIILLKKPIILILLTKEFLPALPLISNYLIGDFLFIFCTLYGAYFLALQKLKVYIFGHIIYVSIYLTGVFILLDSQKLMAIPFANIIAGLITSTFMLVYLFIRYKVLININILFSSLACLGILIFLGTL